MLATSLLDVLREYWSVYRPDPLLFPGSPGSAHSHEVVQQICRRAAREAAIRKRVTVHTLRHSVATHLCQAGIHLRAIHVLLGCDSYRTSERYVHVSPQRIAATPSLLDWR